MRRGFVSLASLGFVAATATAQTIPANIANSLFQVAEDDGAAEVAFKITYPTAAGEAYNVDFNADGAGMTVMGVAVGLRLDRPGPPRADRCLRRQPRARRFGPDAGPREPAREPDEPDRHSARKRRVLRGPHDVRHARRRARQQRRARNRGFRDG
jgi:hypothetical protein